MGLYMGRGAIIVSFLGCYAVTTCIAGYVSGSLYCRSSGKLWIRTMLYTAGLFPGICCTVALVLNIVALLYKSLAAIPFSSIISVVLIWLFVGFPLAVVGTLVGRNWCPRHCFVPCH